jgi:hypothetical protein
MEYSLTEEQELQLNHTLRLLHDELRSTEARCPRLGRKDRGKSRDTEVKKPPTAAILTEDSDSLRISY